MTVILRDFGHTKRCHVMRTVQQPTVAEHSAGVALLCAQLYGGKPSANLLLAALYHDLAESFTGDIPANAKWESRALTRALEELEDNFIQKHGLEVELTQDEKNVLRLADLLDLGFFCLDELQFGNRHVRGVYNNVAEALCKVRVPDQIRESFCCVLNELQRRFRNATYR